MKTTFNKQILALTVLLMNIMLTNSIFQIDLNQTIIQTNRQWSRIKLKYANGTQPYQTYYDSYPKNWNQVIDYIYIPSSQLANNRKFPCRVRAKDNSGDQIKATVVFFTSDSKVYVSDSILNYDQIFDDAFYESGVFKGKPELIVTNSSKILSLGDLNNTNISDFAAQQVVVEKMTTISQIPGAGLMDLLDVLANQNNSLTMGNIQASMKLKNDIINASTVPISTSNFSTLNLQPVNIRQAATGIFSSTNISSTPEIQKLTQDQKQLILINDIRARQLSQTSQQRSIQNIFFRLPGPQQLDAIIITGDAFALVKTIQTVISSDLSCEHKMSYLSDFFGRIKTAINIKAFTATQLNVIIEGAQLQIQRIAKQILFNQQSIQKLGLQMLRNKFNQNLVKLQAAYDSFNAVEREIINKKALLEGLTKNIQDIRTKRDSYLQQIPIQRLQIVQINAIIEQLTRQYQIALGRRTSISTNLQKLNKSVSFYDLKIQDNQKKIDQLFAQATQIQNNKDKIRSNYQALQVSIQRQKSIITSQEKIQAESKALIVNLQQKADIEKTKINNQQVNKLKILTNNLQNISNNITSQIDQINYRCNQVRQIVPIRQNNTVTYSIPTRQYNNYIQTYYQIKPDAINLKTNKISLFNFGILDNSWISAFGNPYPVASFAQTKQFSFNQDFSCIAAPQLQSGTGVIKSVNRKFIEITNLGRTLKLNLAACTRIDSQTPLPQVGQRFYYRGVKGKTDFNLFKGTCI